MYHQSIMLTFIPGCTIHARGWKEQRHEENPILLTRQLEEPKKSSLLGPLVYLAVVVIIIIFVLANLPLLSSLVNLGGLQGLGSNSPGSQSISTQYVTLGNSSVTITYPSDYSTLANYALGIINENRTNSGVPAVTLSPIQSGQQHADSMLQSDYFSHWDTQGYKPYMRYTLLNGTGFVDENVAYEVNTGAFATLQGKENAINTLQYSMVYNDSVCCNNGHERNILNATHNRVSIGIAYDSSHLYFVEDFENYYINLNASNVFSASSATVTLDGSTSTPLNPSSIQVYFDTTPASLSASTLNSQYQKPYDPGSFVGGVLPCNSVLGNCATFPGYVTVYASTWTVSQTSIDIAFSITNFVNAKGNGVYTIYLTQGNGPSAIYYTSISIFIQT